MSAHATPTGEPNRDDFGPSPLQAAYRPYWIREQFLGHVRRIMTDLGRRSPEERRASEDTADTPVEVAG